MSLPQCTEDWVAGGGPLNAVTHLQIEKMLTNLIKAQPSDRGGVEEVNCDNATIVAIRLSAKI